MQNPGGVMVGLTEIIQACLRIFRRARHQWLGRDILHQPQGVYYVFVLYKDILVSLDAKHKPEKTLGEDGTDCPKDKRGIKFTNKCHIIAPIKQIV